MFCPKIQNMLKYQEIVDIRHDTVQIKRYCIDIMISLGYLIEQWG